MVAAAYTYGLAAGNYGVVVKLTRTLMIIPITIALAVMTRRRESPAAAAAEQAPGRQGDDSAAGSTAVHPVRRRLRLSQLVPWFLIGFLIAAGLNSLGAVPHGAHSPLAALSLFLITMALSGIGLSTRPRQLRSAGLRPLALGAILWATVGISSLLLQAATGMH